MSDASASPKRIRRRGDAASRPRMRLFRSDALESTTTISPRAFALIWAVFLSLAVYATCRAAAPAVAVGLALLGLLGWSLFEYAMHRFLFHWETRSKLFARVVFITHGNHHDDPSDPHRNMMPPVISVPVSAAVWGLCLLAFGAAGSAVFLGFAIGYVSYDSIHYACHQFPMRGRLLKRLRRHHARHHYDRREGNYAITAIFWDRVFGTRIDSGVR